jgi:iron(III) transport system substrate-binding protein
MKKARKAGAGRASALALVLVLSIAACERQGSEPVKPQPADLVVYSSHPDELARYVVAEWRERSGASLRLVQGGTGELLARLAEEARASGPRVSGAADILWGGGAESLAANSFLFEAYRSSEDAKIPAEYKAADGTWTGFTVLPMVIAYNSRLLGPERAPRSWSDLLDPRLAGNIAYADPAASGSAYTALRTMEEALGAQPRAGEVAEGREAVARRFARALGGRLLPVSSMVLPAVAAGEYLVGISFENAARELTTKGSDLRIVMPAEGTSAIPDGIALVRGAPHPAAARAFIDFVLGPDVASIVASRYGRRSARSDAAAVPGLPALSSFKTLPYDIAAAARAKRDEVERFASYLREAESAPRNGGGVSARGAED